MRKTKIVCTIGPASETVETLVKLIEAGMNVARLNFSHGTHEEHEKRIENIRKAEEIAGKKVAILLDTKGPEIRTHTVEGGQIYLREGQELIVSMQEVIGNEKKISITYENLVHDVEPGTKILLDDGLIGLEVIRANNKEIVTKVLNSGILRDRKGVNIPNVKLNLPSMTKKDIQDIKFGIEKGVDFIAASFVRRASDVLEIRELLEREGGSEIQIIPKIENQEGLDNVDEILEVADGLMVARGDLGVEIPVEEVPLVQKMLIKKCNELAKPVITATQMLDSMQRNPRPTRAEASDVANAILDGTDAIMLSGETAIGDYPVEAVRTMHNIAKRTEEALNYKELLEKYSNRRSTTVTSEISKSVAHAAYDLSAAAILTPTESGHTARATAKYRPKSPIIAVTSNEKVLRRLSLVWGVYAEKGPEASSTDEMLEIAVKTALEKKYIKHGDLVIITAGVPVGETGTTNLMKVHVIGEVVARGQGIGRKTATGRVVNAKTSEEANRLVQEGDILVTNSTDKEMMPALQKAAAIITEEGGLTSHAAVIGLNLSKPVIVGVKNAMKLFKTGEEITIDSARGDIYRGHASVL